MNKKYLEENKLYEAHKHFMRLCEWSFVPKALEEEGDDDENNDTQQQPPMQGQGNDMGDAQPPMQGQDDVNMGDDMQQQPPMDDGMGEPMGGDSMPNMDGMDDIPQEGGDEDEEVIDVDELTNSQEETEQKVDSLGKGMGQVDSRIASLLTAIEGMEKIISNNNQEIMNLKKEFEKRNPTQTEKLNLRSLDSYPYKTAPTEYWAQQNKNGKYDAYSDNQESTTNEYEITNNDVDDFNEREVADSFYIDNGLQQDLLKIFGMR